MTTIRVKTETELELLINSPNYRMSKIIVDGIIKNLNTSTNSVKLAIVKVDEEYEDYDIVIERKNFLTLLKENEVVFEGEEDFEGCMEIEKAKTYLIIKKP